MNTRRFAGPHVSIPTLTGILLAAIWALQAAAPDLRGNRYLPFLLPVALIGFVLWRSQTSFRHQTGSKNGVVAGLCCWFVGSTLSTVLNWQTDQVLLTYGMVMASGAVVFWSLRGILLTPRDLDVAIIGLTVGALVPLASGLAAFAAEWGVPDINTTITAWQDLTRMDGYEAATFGNRGNTAGFILIVTPILLAIVFDARKRAALRAFCAVPLTLIALNLMILQVRAAFVALFFAALIVWVFKKGVGRLPLVAAAVVLAGVVLFKVQPDVGYTMTERFMPVITVDTRGDDSVQGRVDAIQEGWGIAEENWLLGVGPGAALTVHSRDSAHQLQVQQAMETGILGLIGVTLLSIGVLVSLARTMFRGRHDEVNDTRFMLIIGPATYVAYAIMANAAFNNTTVNTWTVLVVSMLALMPPFERRMRAHAARSRVRATAVAGPTLSAHALPSLAR
jgi:hypothetical protein